jgi:Asp-tRNA(Asn)/Glu-tRNA(Gln) amidotransferase A subunit family amidase
MNSARPTDLCFLPATELTARIRRRDVSPVDVVEAYLNRIEERNPAVNAYTLVLADQAMDAARAAEASVMSGRLLGPLHGVPVAIKDLDDLAGVPTSMGLAGGAKSRAQDQRGGGRKIDRRGRNRSRQDQYAGIWP